MKKLIITICLILLISACAVPTFAIYSAGQDNVTQGQVVAKRMVNLNNFPLFIEDVLTDPEGYSPITTPSDKHENFPLYYYINEKAGNIEIDSTGLNYGIYITRQIEAFSLKCFYTQEISWKIVLGSKNNSIRNLTWYISNYDINEYIDYPADELSQIKPEVYQISGIKVNVDEKTVDTTNAVVKAGVMDLQQKQFAANTNIYNDNGGYDKYSYAVQYMIFRLNTFTTTDIGTPLADFV